MKIKASILVGRSKPTQQRAKESVALILATTAALLDEVGVEGFNTNLLAERANIRVRTVYRYFPNKYAVIIALTETLAVRWDEWMSVLYDGLANPHADWRAALRATRLTWLRDARRVPGALSVLQAMNATPELKELHFRIFESMAQKISLALRTRGLRLPPAKLLAIGRTIVNATNTGMDTYLRLGGTHARQFSSELDASLERYLEPYINTTASGLAR